MVKEDSLHRIYLFDMGFMVIWRYQNSSYSPNLLSNLDYQIDCYHLFHKRDSYLEEEN